MSDVLITQTQKRKKVHIVWPDGQFTVKDIMKSIPEGQKISNVTVQLRINSALQDGTLITVNGQSASTRGRPAKIYRKQ